MIAAHSFTPKRARTMTAPAPFTPLVRVPLTAGIDPDSTRKYWFRDHADWGAAQERRFREAGFNEDSLEYRAFWRAYRLALLEAILPLMANARVQAAALRRQFGLTKAPTLTATRRLIKRLGIRYHFTRRLLGDHTSIFDWPDGQVTLLRPRYFSSESAELEHLSIMAGHALFTLAVPSLKLQGPNGESASAAACAACSHVTDCIAKAFSDEWLHGSSTPARKRRTRLDRQRKTRRL